MEQNTDRSSLYIKPLLECPECRKITLGYTEEEDGIRYRCLNPECSYHAFKKDDTGQAGEVLAILVIIAIVAVCSMLW